MKFLILIPILFLSGCASISTCLYGPKVITERVEVPVPVPCPKPPEIEKPKLTYHDQLKSVDEQVRAIQIDMTLIHKYVTDLESVLDVYRQDPK